MAYRLHKDGESGDSHSDYSTVSLAGIIKLQSDRKKVNKSWRTMQATDLEESGDVDNHDASSGSLCFGRGEHSHDSGPSFGPDYLFSSSEIRPATLKYAPAKQGHLSDTHDGAQSFATFTTATDPFNIQTEGRSTAVDSHAQLFNNLPDPIRLSEQLGEYDGQVVFIGHPNRDISAHQWSTSSFQWVNIGRYSNSRGKVEGSLASDRLRRIDEPHDTLEYFKLAAETRQALVVEHGRSKEKAATVERVPYVGADVAVATHTYRDAPAKDIRIVGQTHGGARASMPLTTRNSFTKHVLEDPFVVATSGSVSQSPNDIEQQSNWMGLTGSLDLTYQFPTTTEMPPRSGPATTTTNSSASSVPKVSFGTGTHRVAFGEEVGTAQHGILTTNSTNSTSFRQLCTNPGYQRFQERLQLRGRAEDLRTVPVHDGLASSVEMLDTAVRHVASTKVAVPTMYSTSAANAAALAHTRFTAAGTGCGTLQPSTGTASALAVGLHYSDPDGRRTNQQREVANGLNQQAPTRQSFKGPFFTESKPTAHDPTIALSIPVSEEEKLVNWFQDGQRPARQKEYTRSLMLAAACNEKVQRHFETIGQAAGMGEKNPYANTAPFVRLYENLSEYVEEYRNGSGQSYFTRHWKAGVPQLRDTVSDNSASYFSKGGTGPRWPRAAVFKPSERSMWG